MVALKPFFTFYGGKWRAAPRYPAPEHRTIVEPFAGAAGYSVRYPDRNIVLVDKDPTIVALWRYLIRATEADILRLPLLAMEESVDSLDIEPEARSLVGFWLNKGTTAPCKTPSAWMRQGLRPRSFWGPDIRARIASQVDAIKHWTIVQGDYSEAPDLSATWFIDPPYEGAGKLYRYGAKGIDFEALGGWCRGRKGQVLVCENDGAAWLPFQPFITIKSTESRSGKGTSKESLWTNAADPLAVAAQFF